MIITSESVSGTVFGIVMICWFVFAATFLLRKRPPSAQEKRRDNAARFGMALEGLGFACVWTFRRPFSGSIFPSDLSLEIAVGSFTVALAIVSTVLVMSAVRTLGKQWALAARLVNDHKLITQGAYSIVRNPIYSGMFGLLIATGLATSRWWILPPAIVLFFAGTMMRVRAEEKLLREAFGEEFEQYTRRVPALVPLLFPGRNK